MYPVRSVQHETSKNLSLRAALVSRAFVCSGMHASGAGQNGTQPDAAQPRHRPPPASPPADTAPPAPVVDRTRRTVAVNTGEAWSILKTAAADSHHADTRALAVAAIGTIEGSRLTHKLLADALNDSDLDVRTAAILAAGATKDKGLYGKLREMLDDKEPQIVFTAAITLWKVGDKSGEDVLMSVIDGERKTDAGLFKGSERAANKELHSPAKMAEFGARQGISIFGGPAGYGLTAWDYTHKHPAGIDPRITALDLLSAEKTANVHNSLLAAWTTRTRIYAAPQPAPSASIVTRPPPSTCSPPSATARSPCASSVQQPTFASPVRRRIMFW